MGGPNLAMSGTACTTSRWSADRTATAQSACSRSRVFPHTFSNTRPRPITRTLFELHEKEANTPLDRRSQVEENPKTDSRCWRCYDQKLCRKMLPPVQPASIRVALILPPTERAQFLFGRVRPNRLPCRADLSGTSRTGAPTCPEKGKT